LRSNNFSTTLMTSPIGKASVSGRGGIFAASLSSILFRSSLFIPFQKYAACSESEIFFLARSHPPMVMNLRS
jgi:hypothetical protein